MRRREGDEDRKEGGREEKDGGKGRLEIERRKR